MSKADLEGGINSFSELAQAIEQAVDVIPIMPQFRYKPNDAIDFLIWCFVNYLRRLEDKPECSYEDVYRFYDERKKHTSNNMAIRQVFLLMTLLRSIVRK